MTKELTLRVILLRLRALELIHEAGCASLDGGACDCALREEYPNIVKLSEAEITQERRELLKATRDL